MNVIVELIKEKKKQTNKQSYFMSSMILANKYLCMIKLT